MRRSHAAVPIKLKKPAKGIKWDHHCELMKNSQINSHLPATMKLNKQSFIDMLSRYKTVYLKPNQGAFGVGVMQVRKIEHEKQPFFYVHVGTQQKKFQSAKKVYDFVLAKRASTDYIVQQGIDLLRWNKRPFDLRLMITKQKDNTWRNEGFVGRAAQPKNIVTNIRSGGTALSIEELLAPYTTPTTQKKVILKLNKLGTRICKHLEKNYSGIQLFGIDIGMDQNLKPWVIEVNTRPEKICWKCMRMLYKKNISNKRTQKVKQK
ncbi:YheC/D like ATP-grasp [Paenibacillus sp. yr247]|uniref:YheC/YheD family protein n=1 Tax=Paenibacillus sp. yr247 TaxID=1761880 RepID=UPI0008923C6D|nr:YheC/YheD family protein [Paenibacillus sp. yr247]SDN40253.1 YheC/D like ATP-grasp [Paenibacillus sp. yr247]